MADPRRSRITPCVFRFALLLLALSPSLPFSPAPLLPSAHAAINPGDLEALKQLFQAKYCFAKDPATAFEKAWKPLEATRKQAGRTAGIWRGW